MGAYGNGREDVYYSNDEDEQFYLIIFIQLHLSTFSKILPLNSFFQDLFHDV